MACAHGELVHYKNTDAMTSVAQAQQDCLAGHRRALDQDVAAHGGQRESATCSLPNDILGVLKRANDRAQGQCVGYIWAPKSTSAQAAHGYIRTKTQGTFGYIRVHSGTFGYILASAPRGMASRGPMKTSVSQDGLCLRGVHSAHAPFPFIKLKRGERCFLGGGHPLALHTFRNLPGDGLAR